MIHADRLASGSSSEDGFLIPKSPFDFSKSLDFLREFTATREELLIDDQSLARAISIGGQPIIFKIRSTGLIKNPRLKYTLYSARSLSSGIRDAALDRIAFFLSISDDLEGFYRLGYGDIDFAPILQKYYGLHHVKFITPFECASWAVLSQRYPMGAAQKVKQTIMEKFGTGLELEHRMYRAFPEPSMLARTSAEELMPLVRNKRRVEFLIGVAKAFSEIDERFLRTAKYDEVAAWLSKINGIGEWSSKLIMLRGLGRMEKLAVETRLLKAASSVYGHGKPLTQARFDQLAERYGPWKGYWAYYLRASSKMSSVK
ncbi:DNA-3-methyladenine glycosylase 2 family protein [Candidatus Bathyarchaeota archaeon]|nr:DNA-3-methyladenine glycosylase 2 family protein [Candidatus Bathyarchaeota archaeon]